MGEDLNLLFDALADHPQHEGHQPSPDDVSSG
jgi:hypothetical protein